MTFSSVYAIQIFVYTNSTYYLQHTTDWTELNVLLCDGTNRAAAAAVCLVAFDNRK